VEEVGVGGVVREFFEWAFVWGDVDPHGGGLGACEPNGCTVVVEVRATALQSLKKKFITTVLTAVKKNKQPTHTPGPAEILVWAG
jgi:hypothetical protein